jgi:hypothetical protein
VPLIELETEVRKPPPGQSDTTGRDVNRWAWDRLCVGFPFLEAGRAGWREVITGAQPSAVSGTVTGKRDNRGQVIVSQTGNAGYIDYADSPRHQLPSTEITVFCRFRYNGSTGTNWGIFSKVHTTGTKSSWGIYAPSTAQIQAVLSTTTAEWTTNTLTGSLSTGVYSNIFFRWRTSDILTLDVLADGGAVLSAQGFNPGGLSGTIVYGSGATAPMRLFGTDTPSGLGGDISVFLVYARRITDAEMRALAADPFLPFRRSPRTPTELGIETFGMVYAGAR